MLFAQELWARAEPPGSLPHGLRYCIEDWLKLEKQVEALPGRLKERLIARDEALAAGRAAAGRASGKARRETGAAARERAAEQREARAR